MAAPGSAGAPAAAIAVVRYCHQELTTYTFFTHFFVYVAPISLCAHSAASTRSKQRSSASSSARSRRSLQRQPTSPGFIFAYDTRSPHQAPLPAMMLHDALGQGVTDDVFAALLATDASAAAKKDASGRTPVHRALGKATGFKVGDMHAIQPLPKPAPQPAAQSRSQNPLPGCARIRCRRMAAARRLPLAVKCPARWYFPAMHKGAVASDYLVKRSQPNLAAA